MIGDVEWSGVQPLTFLLYSVLPGFIIGLLFDIGGGWWRGKKYRKRLWLADALLGLPAAIITLFGALIITDGQLHPTLFCGMLLGFLAEHYTCGRLLTFLLHRGSYSLRTGAKKLHQIVQTVLLKCAGWFSVRRGRIEKDVKSPEKP